jgi:putative ABC transport system permease protein
LHDFGTAFAQLVGNGKSALGKRVMIGIPEHLMKPGLIPEEMSKFQWARVVGIVKSARQYSPGGDPNGMVYIPYAQAWMSNVRNQMTLMLRTTDADPYAPAKALRQLVMDLDPNQPVGRVVSMSDVMKDSVSGERFSVLMLSTFGALALVLAAVGVYGMSAWNFSQRNRELGIRIALGESHQSLVSRLIKSGMRMVLLGMGLGLVVALIASKLLERALFGIKGTDWLSYAAVVLVLLTVALLANWIPTWRLKQIVPLKVIRGE